MNKQTFMEQRRDPRWQKKRLLIMERDHFKCRSCESDAKTLNVHHRYYVKNREVWDYPDFSLVTLCENCHSTAHPFREDDEESTISAWEDALDVLTAGEPEWQDLLPDLAYAMARQNISLRQLVEDFHWRHP